MANVFHAKGRCMISKGMIDRFNAKWEAVESGCHEWTATKHDRGYGYFFTSKDYSPRKMDFAHRFSYHLHYGVKPAKDECVRHTCDNPKCVNPLHLQLGSHKDNIRDMIERKRFNPPNQKMDECECLDAINMRNAGMLVTDVAKMFGISPSQMSRITRGKRKQFGEG